MKKIIIAAFSLLITTSAFAQSDVQDFTSHGIHVILRSTKSNQVVGAILGFQGGYAYGETENPAVAGMAAGVMAESGSDRYPKEAYRDSLARLSTTIAGVGSLYNMTYTLQTVRPNFNSAWAIFSDLLLHPHFDTLEASKMNEQTIKNIEARETDPDAYSEFLADSIWYGASRLNRAMQIPDVEKLTTDDYKAYSKKMFERSRALLVVVGDVSRAEIEAKLAALEALPQGNFKWPNVEHITPVKGAFKYVPKPEDFPTTYVEMRAPAASITDNDWWAQRLLNEIMDKRLFDEIRTKRNLAYTPYMYTQGNYSNFRTRMGFQSILPDSATRVLFGELGKMQNQLVPKEELEHAKEGRITTYYYSTQRNLRQAQALYTDQVEAGDWRIFFQIVPKTEQVTAEQVRDVARKYLHGLSFVLMGPEGKSTQNVYHFQ
jgi:predicted Zn-dependent peptidase